MAHQDPTLPLPPISQDDRLRQVADRYAVAITPIMQALIDPQDNSDPIARQFKPSPRELITTPDELTDPIGDIPHEVTPGLIHRYPDRVLLKAASVCAVYCRYCFRRETVGMGEASAISRKDLARACTYISDHKEIWEVIVSGGDPLILSPRRIEVITTALASLQHVRVIRWHTRIPVVAPEHVTPELVGALKSADKAVFVALHANHAREFTPQARAACAQIVDAGIPMVSQSVLLRGVNDDPASLESLLRTFVENRIKPYYLHHADRAPGTSHFRTTVGQGQDLMRRLRGRVSGLCQPTYVLDLPGGYGKVPIGPTYIEPQSSSETESALNISDPSGTPRAYTDSTDT